MKKINSRQARHSSKQTGFSYNKLILFLLSALVIGVFLYRSFSYFNQVEIHTTSTTLKTGPGVEYKKVATLKKGTRLTVLKTQYHWYKVATSQGKIGWVADWALGTKKIKKITDLSDATIVLDPGHGGNDSGALSNSGKEEKTYTLKYIKELARKLRAKGTKVYLTRKTDTYVTLNARPALAKKVHADAFISIHFDSSPTPNEATGVTTYYYHKKISTSLAYYISNQFNSLGLTNRGTDFGNFLVLRDNTVPAVLLELGYINSSQDFASITSTSYRNSATSDIVTGLSKYFAAKK
ncbi:N-acetylmuramoyl-L-alanine amidase [Ligilactobacillus sp. WILCCON 0076]|uniref:N-acetylmuramoyl-L-alanine amidase n=1 Tax=Ligilactobacillus ubinensis TaxID=2876789 RepID=A0A9X2FLH7_9LACO|nr:N-acetylmuramoyl-L-alanine amidase [Ligilactobacillus ubinensis]MCP0887816.1 N-acetylmuramoyl-L-alanine amidase [Ligilactobacillus ubinensis]